jgi:class 3 adenylate cyclase
MNNGKSNPPTYVVRTRDRVSTTLFSILLAIALVVLAGLAIIAVQLTSMQNQIGDLRDRTMPRVIKLSQLSQEASASIAIAPAMSTNPSRFEFETLLSRIEDKRGSQAALLGELNKLIVDQDAARTLQQNSELLAENQRALTTVVRQQIDVRKRLENHVDSLRKIMAKAREQEGVSGAAILRDVLLAASRLQAVLLDPNRARFSRNRREIAEEIKNLMSLAAAADPDANRKAGGANAFIKYWTANGSRILEDKTAGLTNDFKIKALVEENSLLANRLLSSANAEFWRANEQLTAQITKIQTATRFNLAAMAAVLLAFTAGAIFFWITLQKRIFRRLDSMRDRLVQYADRREIGERDPRPDEIGEISRALTDYMATIDEQEGALASKTKDLENLSTRLAKYLSPQVYDSIFTGKQQVTLESNRKKLTVFFSDIVGFTELADQLESEELTQLLNEYLTEMSRIALKHGATVDKFVGDAIMVFFGDPETNGVDQDALACIEMAIAMRDRLGVLNKGWQGVGLAKALAIRIGIHTGYCTVGNFGSEERMDYTIIGGTVNIASRLENLAEPRQILISYETYALVKDKIDCETQGTVEVRGIAHPVATYSVVDRRTHQNDDDSKFQESSKGIHLEIDRATMSDSDRQSAKSILDRAIRHLDN